MSYMFCKCASLKELNILNFNISKVFNMSYMFYGCSSLIELNFTFNINRKTNIMSIFDGCSDELKNKYI